MTEKPSRILSVRMLPGSFSSIWKGSVIRRRKRCDGITCRTAGGSKHQYLPDEVMNRNNHSSDRKALYPSCLAAKPPGQPCRGVLCVRNLIRMHSQEQI